MAGTIRDADFVLESFCPPGGSINLRLTHLPTGSRWAVANRVGQTREEVQAELFQEAYRDLLAAGWVHEPDEPVSEPPGEQAP